MATKRSQRAAALLRQAVKCLEDGPDFTDRALRLARKAVETLSERESDDETDDNEDQSASSRAPFEKTERQAALVRALTKLTTASDPATRTEAIQRLKLIAPERLEQRKRMGLETFGAAFRREGSTFLVSVAALAREKQQRRA